MIKRVCFFLVVAASLGAADSAGEGLVMLGPKGPLQAQLRYLMNTWPSQFAIGVVRASKPPTCNTPEKGPAISGKTTYCWLEVRPVDLILVKWLSHDPKSPDDYFTIHYWFPKEDKTIDIKEGKDLMVFLAPTHGQDVYGVTSMLIATEQNRESVRSAIKEVFK